VVYGINPLSLLNLVSRSLDQRPSADVDERVEEIKRLHQCVQGKIERANLTYLAQANKHRKKKVFNQLL